MEMKSAVNSMSSTTVATITGTAESQNSSVALEKRSAFEHGMETLSLFGESFEMPAEKRESTAPSSEIKVHIYRVSLSDRLTQSLISAGLVKGIIPMSIRDASGQTTLDTVLREPDGESVDLPRED
jgi:hypothetical protein